MGTEALSTCGQDTRWGRAAGHGGFAATRGLCADLRVRVRRDTGVRSGVEHRLRSTSLQSDTVCRVGRVSQLGTVTGARQNGREGGGPGRTMALGVVGESVSEAW